MKGHKIESFVLFLLILCVVPSCLAQEVVDRVKSLYANDRLEELEEILPQAVELYPDHPTVRFMQGILEHDAQKAIAHFRYVFENSKNSDFADHALLRLGQFDYINGEYGDARKKFSYLARHYPDSRLKDDAQYLFCQSYLAEGKTDTARVFFKSFIDNAPQSPYSDLAIDDLESTGERGERQRENPENAVDSRYSIQIGAFRNRENAERVFAKFEEIVKTVQIVEKRVEGKIFYAVWIGSFTSKSAAKSFAKRIVEKYTSEYRLVEIYR